MTQPSEPAPTRHEANPLPRWLWCLPLIVVSLYLAFERAWSGGWGWPLDDGWIHLQFARSLAQGRGLAYQADHWVAGSTAPLWTAILSILYLVPGAQHLVLAATKTVGLVLFLASGHAVARLAMAHGVRPGVAILAAVSFWLTDWMAWSALSGMEISLFVWLTAWGMTLHLEQRRSDDRAALTGPPALLVIALSSWVRPEGLLLLALTLLDSVACFARRRSEPALLTIRWSGTAISRGLLPSTIALLPAASVFWLFGGTPLPTTLSVKTVGVSSWLPQLRDLWTVAEILFRPVPALTALAPVGALLLIERLGTSRDRGLLPVLWLFTLPAAYSVLSSGTGKLVAGNFGRYFFPLFVPVIVLAAVALDHLADALPERLEVFQKTFTYRGAAIVLVLLPSVLASWSGAQRYATNVANVEQSDVRAARWLEQNVPPGTLLAVQDIGAIGYLTDHPLIDMAGIVNPDILPYLKGELRGADPTGLGGLFLYLKERRPRYLCLYPASYGGLEVLRSLEPALKVVARFPIERNITMAGSELVIVSTPW